MDNNKYCCDNLPMIEVTCGNEIYPYGIGSIYLRIRIDEIIRDGIIQQPSESFTTQLRLNDKLTNG
jgi:hypothetical protein